MNEEINMPADRMQGISILNRLKNSLPLLLIVGLAGVAFSQGWHTYLSFNQLAANRDWLQGFISENLLLAGALYIALYCCLVAVSFPGASFVTIGSGLLFGWLLAGALTAVGATFGASAIFLAAKTSFGAALRERAGPMLQKFAEGFEKDAFNYLLSLRLMPIFPFWLVNIAPSLFNVRLKTYMLATFLGILPGTFAYTFLGSGLGSVIDAQMEHSGATTDCLSQGSCSITIDIGSLVTPQLALALLALGLVSLTPIAIKRLRKVTHKNG